MFSFNYSFVMWGFGFLYNAVLSKFHTAPVHRQMSSSKKENG